MDRVPRGPNSRAKEVATRSLQLRGRHWAQYPLRGDRSAPLALRVSFDGGFRAGVGTSGIVVEAGRGEERKGLQWETLLDAGVYWADGVKDSMEAELRGLLIATCAATMYSCLARGD